MPTIHRAQVSPGQRHVDGLRTSLSLPLLKQKAATCLSWDCTNQHSSTCANPSVVPGVTRQSPRRNNVPPHPWWLLMLEQWQTLNPAAPVGAELHGQHHCWGTSHALDHCPAEWSPWDAHHPSSPQIGVDAKGRVPPNQTMTIPTDAGFCQLKNPLKILQEFFQQVFKGPAHCWAAAGFSADAECFLCDQDSPTGCCPSVSRIKTFLHFGQFHDYSKQCFCRVQKCNLTLRFRSLFL